MVLTRSMTRKIRSERLIDELREVSLSRCWNGDGPYGVSHERLARLLVSDFMARHGITQPYFKIYIYGLCHSWWKWCRFFVSDDKDNVMFGGESQFMKGEYVSMVESEVVWRREINAWRRWCSSGKI